MSEFKRPRDRIPKREINSVLENPSATKKLTIAGKDAENFIAIPVIKYPSNWREYVSADKMIITLEISDSDFLRATTEKMIKNRTMGVGDATVNNTADADYISTPTAVYTKLSGDMYMNSITPGVHGLLYFGKIENLCNEVSAFLDSNKTEREIIIYTPSQNCIRAIFPLRNRVTIIRTVVE